MVQFPKLLISLVLVWESQTVAGESTLKSVHIIYGNGDRNPLRPYPTDPYSDSSQWPEGFGSLTGNGILRMYNLGKYSRGKYPGLVERNVAVFSSNSTASIQSAKAHLLGFIGQPQSALRFLNTLEPISLGIQVVSEEEDDFIDIKRKCQKWLQLVQNYLSNSEDVKSFRHDNKYAYRILRRNTGMNFTGNEAELLDLLDTLLIQKSRRLQLAEWAEKLDKSSDLCHLHVQLFNLFTSKLLKSIGVRRLRTGGMIKRFMEEVEASVFQEYNKVGDNSPHSPKVTIISGDTKTLAHWMIDLEIYDAKGIGFGEALFLEIHRNEGQDHMFKVYYKNETGMEAYHLELPRCPTPCSFEKLKVVLEPLVVEDWGKECRAGETSQTVFSSKSSQLALLQKNSLVLLFGLSFHIL